MLKEINQNGRRLLNAAAMIFAAIFSLTEATNGAEQMMTATIRLPIEGEMPSLGGATAWLNSPKLTTASLRGKVVLVDFWTYTCINWRRSLPYIRA